ncbi:M48 family metallopeptidase [Candidatus Beckwithbacteria bacterium]|nr:M48 family metallopeptidase [Candidatus Beckwithbacteria bacterium]
MNYKVRKSKRAKNISISIRDGEVVVTKPWYAPNFLVDQVVKKHQDWIVKNLAKQNTSKTSKNTIYYLGKVYRVLFNPGRLSINYVENEAQISAYNEMAAKRSLKEWHRNEARKAINLSVKSFSKAMEVNVMVVRLKDQSSRWGSCSSASNLNFSWRLILTPPEVLNYVVIHELAHLTHMNHSRKFWDLVEKFDPDYREHRRWLNRYGHTIKKMWYD